jgi:hypothetical protein
VAPLRACSAFAFAAALVDVALQAGGRRFDPGTLHGSS